MSPLPNGAEMLAGVAVIPLIVGIVQLAKSTFLKGHTEYAPWVALILGLFFSVGYALATGTQAMAQLAQSTLIGLAYGLAASGLYAGVAQPAIQAYKAQQAKTTL